MKRSKTMGTTLERELIARIPKRARGSSGDALDLLTPSAIKAEPKNVVFGKLIVLKKPEPIGKKRGQKRR
jgi:hypothetical protein